MSDHNDDQYVYIFSLGFGNLYKIGRSKNWQIRLSTFQISNPKIKMVCVRKFPDASRIERYLQFINATQRRAGEVFKFSQHELTDAINHLKYFAEHGLTLGWRKRYAQLQMDDIQAPRARDQKKNISAF